MSNRPGRKRQPLLSWFPPWRSPSQASKQPKPPSIPSQLPPAPSPSSPPQLEVDRTRLPPSPSPSSRLTKAPSFSSSGRRELPPQDEPPRARVDSEELGKSDAQFPEFESKQVTETETGRIEPDLAQLTEEMKPAVDMEARKDPEALLEKIHEEKSDLDSDAQQLQQDKSPTKIAETKSFEPDLAATEEMKPGVDMELRKDPEAQLEKIQEEKSDLDSEAQQLQRDKSPIKIAETEEVNEEFHSRGVENSKENVSEETKKVTEPKISIKVSDSMPPGGITEQETPEESKRHKSAIKERKITISTTPQASSQNLGQPGTTKALKDGLSRLAQKLSIGHQNKSGNEQGVSIITLASENQGASMFIGHEIQPGKKVGKSNETREENYHNVRGNQSIVASINCNVQGINSSILEETNYSERNPGVHMTISTKPASPVSITGKTESKKAASSITSPEKLTYEPNIRRRCLRGLLMESSEDDLKKGQKPRRHGCRFSCEDKTKGKMEDI